MSTYILVDMLVVGELVRFEHCIGPTLLSLRGPDGGQDGLTSMSWVTYLQQEVGSRNSKLPPPTPSSAFLWKSCCS